MYFPCPTVDEVIKIGVVNTLLNLHISETNPGFQNTLKEIFTDSI
jgi:hypothetical protein